MSCNRNDCAYKSTNTGTCDYILVTGKRRGCPAGPLCLRYKTVTARERKVPQLPSTFKKDRSGLYTAFQSLYEEGYSDQEIMSAHEKAALVLKTKSGLVRKELTE